MFMILLYRKKKTFIHLCVIILKLNLKNYIYFYIYFYIYKYTLLFILFFKIKRMLIILVKI